MNAQSGTGVPPVNPPPALLRLENLSVRFPARRGLFDTAPRWIEAVRNVTLGVARGEFVGIVGESGSGKTTACRAVLRLAPVSAGKIFYDGAEISALPPRAFFPYRRRIQMVFQDPWHSLNPRLTIGAALAEPLEIHFPQLDAPARRERVTALLRSVELEPEHARRYPHELSGGQRQRVGIARALAVEPELVICDEPVSALDVSVQARVIALLRELQAQRGFACVFISHDLALVEQLCARVVVMRAGEIVESGAPAQIYRHPRHAYTRALLESVPDIAQCVAAGTAELSESSNTNTVRLR